jgi:hypothetical protein
MQTSAANRDPGLGAMALRAAATHPGVALRFRRNGAWHELSFQDFGLAVREIGAGLIVARHRAGRSRGSAR